MFLDRRSRLALVRIEADLTRSDPGLAGRFQRFNDWVAYERRATRRGLARTVLVVVLMTAVAALLIAGAMAETGGLGGSNGPGLAAEILAGNGPVTHVVGAPARSGVRPGITRNAPASCPRP